MTDPDFLHNRRIGYDLTAAAYADRFHGHLDFDEGRFEAVCA